MTLVIMQVELKHVRTLFVCTLYSISDINRCYLDDSSSFSQEKVKINTITEPKETKKTTPIKRITTPMKQRLRKGIVI